MFRPGDEIEVCELLLIPKEQVGELLSGYVFHYNTLFQALPLGNGALYNHSIKPNLRGRFDFKRQLLIFEASKIIRPSQELLINYGYSKDHKKLFKITD